MLQSDVLSCKGIKRKDIEVVFNISMHVYVVTQKLKWFRKRNIVRRDDPAKPSMQSYLYVKATYVDSRE